MSYADGIAVILVAKYLGMPPKAITGIKELLKNTSYALAEDKREAVLATKRCKYNRESLRT